MMKILFLGDIVGNSGCEAVKKNLPSIIKKNSIIVFDDYYLNNKKIIKKFGCNKIINSISKKEFEKKFCKFTDNFINNGEKLRIKMFYLKKIK